MALLRSRLDPHVVRRVGVHQVDGGAVEQAVHVLRLAGVAAQQAVLASSHRSPGCVTASSGGSGTASGSVCPSFVSDPSSRSSSSAEKPVKVEVEVHLLQLGQLADQLVVVPGRQRRGLVVREPVRLDLGRRQAHGHVDRDRVQAQLQRRLVARVADDDDAVLVDHDRLAEAELADRRGDGVHGGVVPPGVVLVRTDAVDRSLFDVHGYPLLEAPPRSLARPRSPTWAGRRRRVRALDAREGSGDRAGQRIGK